MTNDEIKAAIELGKKLQLECRHEVVEQCGYEGWSLRCSICGEGLGWYCPDSPNHVCEYYGYHWGDDESDEPYTDEDDCIYCHQPEERK